MSLGMQPLVMFTGLRAGRHIYRDPHGNPQVVLIEYDDEGIPWAHLLDAEEEDAGVILDARGMAGTFERVSVGSRPVR